MTEKMTEDKEKRKLGTRLHLDDITARALKPPKNLVPRKNKSLGYIRSKKIHGRIYYQWVRTVYRGLGLPPGQEIVMHIGTTLPHGVKLGPVDEKTAKKLSKIASGENRPTL